MTARGSAIGLRGSAARNRVIALGVVAAYTAVLAWLEHDPLRRAQLHHGIVLTLGYGHLVGAYVQSLGRPAGHAGPRAPARGARTFLVWTLVLGLHLLYMRFLAAELPVVLALLGLATWHTVENDLALEDAYRAGGRLGPPGGTLDDWLAAAGLAGVVAAAAGALLVGEARSVPSLADTPAARLVEDAAGLIRGGVVLAGAWLLVRERTRRCEALGLVMLGAGAALPHPVAPGRWLAFGDLFAAVTLYHLVSWLVLLCEQRPRGGRARVLVLVHAVPIALALASLALPEAAGAAIRGAMLAPAPYLFWSVAHVGHTLWVRRARARARPSPAGGNACAAALQRESGGLAAADPRAPESGSPSERVAGAKGTRRTRTAP